VRDALLLVDVLNDFEHEDGEKLLESFRSRHDGFVAALERARADGLTVVYANDTYGDWRGNGPALVQRALEGRGGELVEAIAPDENDCSVVKPRYSAFDHTPLELILREREVERLLLGGMSTEGCDAQTEAYTPTGPYFVDGCDLPADLPQAVQDVAAYLDQDGATTPALEFLSPVKGPALEQITVEVGSVISTADKGAALYDEDVKKQAQQLGLPGWS